MFLSSIRAFFSLIIIAVSGCAAFWSFCLAKADLLSQADSIPSRQAAVNLTPGDSKSWIRLAHLQEQRGQDALPSFIRAEQASPLSADAWIGAGLEHELAGHLDQAEQSLLHAAQISREYVPRSTLANFYFRRNDPAHFWPWAKQALTTAIDDQQSIFRMSWALSSDAAQIETSIIPDSPVILGQYLVWLTSSGKLEAADSIAARLLPVAKDDDVPALLFYCTLQVAKGRINAPKQVWSQLLAKHLISPAEDSATTGLVNGQFEVKPTNSGLDWALPTVPGVTTRPTFPGLRVTLSGNQPESCVILVQYVALEGGRQYRLWYEYQTTDIAPGSGLAWRMYDMAAHVEFTKNSPSLALEKAGRESVTFVTPPKINGGLLVLSYIRAPGTTRISGWLQLKQAGLQAVN